MSTKCSDEHKEGCWRFLPFVNGLSIPMTNPTTWIETGAPSFRIFITQTPQVLTDEDIFLGKAGGLSKVTLHCQVEKGLETG